MAINPFQNYTGSMLQGSQPMLQGSQPVLQGSSPTLQGTPPTPTYGNTAATSPAREKYINDLSSKYGLSSGTVYDKTTNQGLDLDAFKKATGIQNPDWSSLKFDTAYKPVSFDSIPTPTTIPSTSTAPRVQSTIPVADPMKSYKSAFDKYLKALKPSQEVTQARQKYLDFVQSAESGIAGLEGQGRGIPLSLIRGQQEKLGRQAEITAKRLQGEVGIAEDAWQSGIEAAKAGIGYEEALQTYGRQALKDTAGAMLQELQTLPDDLSKDNYIRTKANELGLSIDAVNTALQQAQAGSGLIKLSEGDVLYDPNTGLPVYTAPKESPYGSVGSYSVSGQLSPLAQSVVSGIINIADLPSEARAAVAAELAQSQVPSQRQQALQYNLQTVNELLNNPNLSSISGYIQGKLGLGSLLPGAQLAINQYNQLKGILSLENREKLKGSGAISDYEFKVLSQAASALGRNLSDAEFKKQLENIRDVFEGKYASTRAGAGGQIDDPLGLGFNRVGNTSASTGMRTDRHNNPTAFTTDVAKTAGLVLGKDYVIGDPFPNNPNLRTARLIGDPIQQTIKVIDRIGFYTQSGKPRWSYVNQIPQARNWKNLSYAQKAQVIGQMYQREGGSKLKQYFA